MSAAQRDGDPAAALRKYVTSFLNGETPAGAVSPAENLKHRRAESAAVAADVWRLIETVTDDETTRLALALAAEAYGMAAFKLNLAWRAAARDVESTSWLLP